LNYSSIAKRPEPEELTAARKTTSRLLVDGVRKYCWRRPPRSHDRETSQQPPASTRMNPPMTVPVARKKTAKTPNRKQSARRSSRRRQCKSVL